ncbi:MAG: Holliday junction resolvase RuvX [Bacteroidota bacterium]|jgi:putative Holliday junction resolvase|nr:Holliday junction resolvase RuvX [Bacteroidota bacterium]
MARYIAFDYGTRRIGIAVTDSGAIVAAPECTCSPEDLPNVLKRLVEAEPCAGFVVGMPGLILGTTTDSTAPIRAFVDQLRKAHPDLPVELVDEDDTSREASLAMVQSGMRKSKRREKGQLDQIAATLILQRFLDRR